MSKGQIWDNRFELQMCLKEDAKAEIWLALQDKHKLVIIKRPVLPCSPVVLKVRQQQLQEEAALLKSLAAVPLTMVPVVFMEATEAPYYFVMEHVYLSNNAGRARIRLSDRLLQPEPFSALEALFLLRQVAQLIVALEKDNLVHGKLTADNLFWERQLGLKVIGWSARGRGHVPDLNSLLGRLLPQVVWKVQQWPNAKWKSTLQELWNDFRLDKKPDYKADSFSELVDQWLGQAEAQIEQHKSFIRGASSNDEFKARSKFEKLREQEPSDSDLPELEQIVGKLELESHAQAVWLKLQKEDWPGSQLSIRYILRKKAGHQATLMAYWLAQVMPLPPHGCPSIAELLPTDLSLPPEPDYLWQELKEVYLSGNCQSEALHLLLAEARTVPPLSLRISYLRYVLKKFPPPSGAPTADVMAKHWEALYCSSNQANLASLLTSYQAVENDLKELKISGWHWPVASRFVDEWAKLAQEKLADLDKAVERVSSIAQHLQEALTAQQGEAYDEVAKALKLAHNRDSESPVLDHLRQQVGELCDFLRELEEGVDIRPDEELSQSLSRIHGKVKEKGDFLINTPTLANYLTWFKKESVAFVKNWQELQTHIEVGMLGGAVPSLEKALTDPLKRLAPPLGATLERLYLIPCCERIEVMRQSRKALSEGYTQWKKGNLKAVQSALARVIEPPLNNVIHFDCLQEAVKAVLALQTGTKFGFVWTDLDDFKSSRGDQRVASNAPLQFASALVVACEQAVRGNVEATRQETTHLVQRYPQQANWPVVIQLWQVIEWMEGWQQARQAFVSGRWWEAPQLLKESTLLPPSLLQNELKQQEKQARLLAHLCDEITLALQAWQKGRYQDAYQRISEIEQDAQALSKVEISSVKALAKALQRVMEAVQGWSLPNEPTKANAAAVRKPLELIIEQEKPYRAFLGQPTRTEERLQAANQLLQYLQSGTPRLKIVAYIDHLLNKEDEQYIYRAWLEEIKSSFRQLTCSEGTSPSLNPFTPFFKGRAASISHP